MFRGKQGEEVEISCVVKRLTPSPLLYNKNGGWIIFFFLPFKRRKGRATYFCSHVCSSMKITEIRKYEYVRDSVCKT